MERSSYFLEIFGGDDLPARQNPTREPVTPLDDELWAHLPGGSRADKEIKRLEDSAMIAEIAGCDESEAQKIVAPPADTLELDLQKMLERASDAIAKAPVHRERIAKIVSGMRSCLRKFEGDSTESFDEIYDRIAGSMEKCLKTALILG